MNRLLILVQVAHLSYSVLILFSVFTNGAIIENVGGYAAPIGIVLKGSEYALIFIVLTSFIFLVSLIFGMGLEYNNRLFLLFLMTLETLLIGIFLSNDLFNLFILIEVSTIVISILIMYKKGNKFTYDALLFLLNNIMVMTFYLFGLGFIYKIFGTFDLDLLKEYMPLVTDSKQLIIPFSLIMLAVSTKIAMFPLYFWLPKAHSTPSAPSNVSAILSGVFIKGGVSLFIRITDVFSYHFDVSTFFVVIGIITAISGFLLAYTQLEFKRILAYHSISQLGLIIIGLAIGYDKAFYGGFYHIINHGLFKPLLFLCGGAIAYGYKTKKVSEVRGLFKTDPYISFVLAVGILSISGFPLLNGYYSKKLIFSGADSLWVSLSFMLIQFGTILSFTKFSTIFFGEKNEEYIKPNIMQYISFTALALSCLVLGFANYGFINVVFDKSYAFDFDAVLISMIEYACYVLLAFIVHRYLYPKIQKMSAAIRKYELSFNSIATNAVMYLLLFIAFISLS